MTFSTATLADVQDAFNSREEFNLIGSRWIQLVDPETFEEVETAYRIASEVDGSLSLYNVFCTALKLSQK